MQQLNILGIKVTAATMADIHSEMDRIIAGGGPGFVLSANAHAVNLARSRPWLAAFFKAADLVHVDGGGIILGARLLGHNISERITWADWVWPLARHIAANQYRLYLLGGPPGLTDQAAERLQTAVPGLRIVGTHHGYFQKQGTENYAIIDAINKTRPDILWLGMGMPLQEQWLKNNYPKLRVKLHMICGAAFKHMAGRLVRAPKWMCDFHLEWLYLLLQDPKRGAIRYLWGNPVFLFFVLLERWRNRSLKVTKVS